jgi:hypothetical protein
MASPALRKRDIPARPTSRSWQGACAVSIWPGLAPATATRCPMCFQCDSTNLRRATPAAQARPAVPEPSPLLLHRAESMRIDRSYVGAVALSGVANAVVSGLATALLLPTLIAKIGLAAYGNWAMLGIFQAVASLLEIGMSKAIVYFVPRAPSAQWLILRQAAGYVVGTSLIFVLIALPLRNLGPVLLGAAGARDPGLAMWILIAGSVKIGRAHV